MKEAISSFAALKAAKKMFILGDMLELGSESKAGHAAVINQLKSLGDAEIALVGPRFMEAAGDISAHLFRSSDEISAWLSQPAPRDIQSLLKARGA